MRFILAAAFVALGLQAAHAEFKVCNDSGVSRSLAIGYGKEGSWTSEGWWVIGAGDCKVVIDGPLKNRYIYWRATAVGEDFPDDNYMFCTKADPFTIEGADDCAARGYRKDGFRVADTGTKDPDYTLILTHDNSGQKTAAAAPDPAPKATVKAPAPDAKPKPPKKPATAPSRPKGFTGPVPASGPAFTPGQGGAAFTRSALMQGCGPSDGGVTCRLYADGWLYIVTQNAITPREIIDTLFALPPNTPVQITGESVAEDEGAAEVNLSQIEPGPPDPKAVLRAGLQGKWVSLEDPQSRITVHGSELTDFYGAEKVATSVLTVDSACADGSAGGDTVLNLVDMNNRQDAPICWSVDEVTPDRLNFTYAARGNPLTFRRE